MLENPLRSIALMVMLILVNAFVSAVETALNGINEANVRKRAEEGDKKSERLLKMLEANDTYINTVEFLLVSFNMLIGVLFAFSIYTRVRLWLGELLFISDNSFLLNFVMVIVVLLLIYIVAVVSFVFPKKLAIKHAEKIAYSYGFSLTVVTAVLYPILWLADKNTKLLLWLFRVKPEELEESVTEEEIISIVNEGQEQGILDSEEAEMISNIIEFDEKEVKDIMTHRKKIVAIDAAYSIEEALRFMLNESYSRFPLYQENIDDIIGIVHLKDVIRFHLNPELSHLSLREVASEPYFVPDTQNIDSLLHDMQTKKIHMAVVIDEYGQTAGIVAMEDILEEIVGDIQDEYDTEEENITEQDEDEYLVTGETNLEELSEHLGIEFEEEDFENFDTLNGLLISKLDRIPMDGETAVIKICGYEFEIIEAMNKMIRLVRITKIEPEDTVEELLFEEE